MMQSGYACEHHGTDAARMRAIVISDNDSVRQELNRFLAGIPNMEVKGQATTGWEGIKVAGETKPHVVFVDFHLPDMTGAAIAKSLKSGVKPPGVIVMTRNLSNDHKMICKRAGADGYIAKDDFDLLLPIIN